MTTRRLGRGRSGKPVPVKPVEEGAEAASIAVVGIELALLELRLLRPHEPEWEVERTYLLQESGRLLGAARGIARELGLADRP